MGPMIDAGQCSNLQKCQLCSAVCNCGGQGTLGQTCIGQSQPMACLGESDALRDTTPTNFALAVQDPSQCNASAPTGTPRLYYKSRCGAEPCCPTTPFVPSGCMDSLDVEMNVPGQCAWLVESGTYTCVDNFCPTCGVMAGKCDKTCRYRACSVCGDCFRSSPLTRDGPELCDDGNSEDGDGCSSGCVVEPGWNCSRVTKVVIGQGTLEVDECHTCTDYPRGWSDAQGYTCEDYENFGACDAGSQGTDPLVIGGRRFETPSYHAYKFAYELEVRDGKPLFLQITVLANANVHLFIGDPLAKGFEIVIGGWNNGLSKIRRYPGKQTVGHLYARVLDPLEPRNFWLYYDHGGNLSLGEGHALGERTMIDGGDATRVVQAVEGWTSAGASALNRLSIATGWRSTGVWDLRLRSGSLASTLAEMANFGLDATQVCCVCGGGVHGKPCDLQSGGFTQAGPRTAAPTVAPGGRRLAAAMVGTPVMMGPVIPDGFKMLLHFSSCTDWTNLCELHAIIVPEAARSHISLPLGSIWPQIREPLCRLKGHSLVGTELRWEATKCNMSWGSRYVAALHLTSADGANSLQLFDFVVPKPPTAQPRAVYVDDVDPVQGKAAGRVMLKGAADETGILQYRLFWGLENGTKVDSPDPLSLFVGAINTYGGGGLRNEYGNQCLFSDCNWGLVKAKSSRRRGRHAIRHSVTGECLCYRNKVLAEEPCPSEVLSLDAPETYTYINNGEGLLISRHPPQNELYMLAMYRDFGDDYAVSLGRLEVACTVEASCVGVFLNWNPSHNTYLEGGLLFDRSRFTGIWPYPVPSNFPGGASKALYTYENSIAEGPPSTDRTSLNVDKGWHHFQSYRKAPKARSCLWSLEDRIINSTIEARMVNDQYGECLCQVPRRVPFSSDGQTTEVPVGAKAAELMIGKMCNGPTFGFIVGGEAARTKGYCEWTSYTVQPGGSAVVKVDANDNATAAAPVVWNPTGSAAFNAAGHSDIAAWELSGAGRLQLNSGRLVPEDHTFAAWVNLRGYAEVANVSGGEEPARFNIFAGIRGGIEESCLQIMQRAALDDRTPYCPTNACTDTEAATCCGPSATTGPTGWSTSCNCQCPVLGPMTDEVANDFGSPLAGDSWSVGLRSCASPTPWDSGASLTVPANDVAGWTLLVAVGSGASDGTGETVFYASRPEPNMLTRNGSFGCASINCTATASIRDIPRGGSYTCALNVGVYVTDYVNQHGGPNNSEVVEYISVRGGIPEVGREIRRHCHPDGANEHDRLFLCVRRHPIDDLVRGSNASSALRVDVKISGGVDAFPKDGMLLSGLATVECRRIVARDRHAPASGGLQKVGVAARSCTGSTLQAVGGSAGSGGGGAPLAQVAQAWVFDRRLQDEELSALFHSTRTRYFPDYQVQIHGKKVITPGPQVISKGRLRCRVAGCTAYTVLRGLPTEASSTCLLTVSVAITDFSSESEYIEWIRLDGVDVVTQCQIGRDDEIGQYHLCADNLDVSPRVLEAAFLNDGQVRVEAKITEQVDRFPTRENWLLDADVSIHCTGNPSPGGPIPFEAVVISPLTTHMLAVSSNEQGEGAVFAGSFRDVVNGFLQPPAVIDASQAAAHLGISVTNENGALWVYAVGRQDRDVVTLDDIVADSLGSRDICSESHRRRGPDTVRRFKTDPYMTRCEFEPGVPYTLLIYVDKLEEPWGGGRLAQIDLVGPPSTLTSLKPKLKARRVEFTDSDSLVRRISGTLTITRAYSEDDITDYYLFFGRSGTKMGSSIATVPATGAQQYYIQLNSLMLPFDVNTFLVCSRNSYGVAQECRRAAIMDNSLKFLALPLVSEASSKDPRYLKVTLQLNQIVGARADVAIVPEGAEVAARPQSDYRSLDYNRISRDVICDAPDRQFDQPTTTFQMGPCDLTPGKRYSMVILVAIRVQCPCTDPCLCIGEMTTAVQADAASGITTNSLGHFIPPDNAAPTLTASCGPGCPSDDRFDLSIELNDLGQSYPILVKCAACVEKQPGATTPSGCIRNKDTSPHRYWRVFLPTTSGTCLNSLRIAELEFYHFHQEEEDGKLVHGSDIWTSDLSFLENPMNAFDGNHSTTYGFQTSDDFWLGLDFGLGTPEAIYRARVRWDTNWTSAECPNREIKLEWSDDGITWTWRATVSSARVVGAPYTDVFVNVSKQGWDQGTLAQAVLNGEGPGAVLVDGLNPGTLYGVHCLAVDSASNSLQMSVRNLRTRDSTPPNVRITGANASDFAVNTTLRLVDPGKYYPALSTCVVREKTSPAGTPLPTAQSMNASSQRCHHEYMQGSPVNDGRVRYQELFKARMTEERDVVRFTQVSWNGKRKEATSCGLRHRAMNGPGSCGATSNRKERLALQILLQGHGDAYLFVGPSTQGAVGYEVVFGCCSNTATAIRKGVSLAPMNRDYPQANTIASHSSTPQQKSHLDPFKFRAFWLTIDPETGWVRMGLGKYIGINQIMESYDPSPVMDINQILVGAGYHSRGNIHTGANMVVCPGMGNLALHRPAFASSTSFGGTPDKITDGQGGDGHFCEYCHPSDPKHVCAQTRRQGEFDPPYLRVDLGGEFTIGSVRIIGPAKNEDSRPEQAQGLSIHVGFQGFGADPICARVEDARGDNVFECLGPMRGSWVSVLGNAGALKALPEAFGIRICEIEVYEHWSEFESVDRAKEYFYAQQPLTLTAPATEDGGLVEVRGLEPNRDYQLFCYAEDSLGNSVVSNSLDFRTSDTTPPHLEMTNVKATNDSIAVTVYLEDPGGAYPGTARCAATIGGRAPQEHDFFFVHRYWRVRTHNREHMDPGCYNKTLVRHLSFRDLNGEELPGLQYRYQWTATKSYGYNDNDGDGLAEVPEEALWALPEHGEPWVGLDTTAVEPFEKMVRSAGGATQGDFVITVTTGNSTIPLELNVKLPDGSVIYLGNRTLGGGVYDVSCFGESHCGGVRLESVAFSIVAQPGQYSVSMRTRDGQAADSVTVQVRTLLCGSENRDLLTLDPDVEDNATLPLRNYFLSERGCARTPPHAARKTWQSSTMQRLEEEALPPPGVVAISDGNLDTCVETGGEGRRPADARATWRLALGQRRVVDALWLAGKLNGTGRVASHVDVYVAEAEDQDLGQMAVCATGVPVGNIVTNVTTELDGSIPARSVRCRAGASGSHVVLVANPPGKALSLCEFEVRTLPQAVVSELWIQWGGANQSSGACGANDVSIDWSDDNTTWYELWKINSSHIREVQRRRWSWWHRLFALNFGASFSNASSHEVTITHLRENATYDVFCWATDALGNDISKDLVTMELPWADTHVQGTTDSLDYRFRRLQASETDEGNQVMCTEAILELMPCEEKIVTKDNLPPKILVGRATAFESLASGAAIGASEKFTWELDLNDPSCVARKNNKVKCTVRCDIKDPTAKTPKVPVAETAPRLCTFPTCVERSWSNEAPAKLSFSYLRPGGTYELECRVADPWGNEREQRFEINVPEAPTTPKPPPTPAPYYDVRRRRTTTSPPPAPPAPTPRPWKYAPPEVDAGWQRAIKVPSTSYRAPYQRPFPVPQPTPAPVPPPTQGWSEPNQRQEQTTTAVVPDLGAVMPPGGRMGPSRLYANLALGSSTQAGAELMQWPGAVNAILSAARTALSLSSDDAIEAQDVVVVPPSGRRLAEAAGLWQVRVRLVVTTMGQAHSSMVEGRLQSLGAGGPSMVQDVLQEQLRAELATRGLGGGGESVSVVGAQVWQDGEPSAPLLSQEEASRVASRAGPSPPQQAPAVATPQQQPEWQRPPDDSDSMEELVVPIVGALVGVLVCVLAVGICVLYAYQNAKPQAARGPRIAAAPTAHAQDEPTPHKIAWDPDEAKAARCPTPASTCSTTTGNSGGTDPSASSSQLRASGAAETSLVRADTSRVKARPAANELELRSCNSPAEPRAGGEAHDASLGSPPAYFFMPQLQHQRSLSSERQPQAPRHPSAGRGQTGLPRHPSLGRGQVSPQLSRGQASPQRHPSVGRGQAVSPAAPRVQTRRSGNLR